MSTSTQHIDQDPLDHEPADALRRATGQAGVPYRRTAGAHRRLRLWMYLFAALVVLTAALTGSAHASATGRSMATPLATPSAGSRPPQTASSYPTPARVAASGTSYALAFTGKAVSFDLSGLEPDFDPIYKLIVSGTLHDRRAAAQALPDATLILTAYLEVFQPDTVPVLPDLLHPDQQAGLLAGFLSGKAALVNRGGRVVYRGSLLAEIFQDSTEHLVVDLDPANGIPGGPSVRLQGTVSLHRGGGENGTMHALAPFTRAALAVPRGPAPSWQAVVNSLSVHRPAMMGTARSPAQRAPAKPLTIAPMAPARASSAPCGTICSLRRPTTMVPVVVGGALLLVGMIGWRRSRTKKGTRV